MGELYWIKWIKWGKIGRRIIKKATFIRIHSKYTRKEDTKGWRIKNRRIEFFIKHDGVLIKCKWWINDRKS